MLHCPTEFGLGEAALLRRILCEAPRAGGLAEQQDGRRTARAVHELLRRSSARLATMRPQKPQQVSLREGISRGLNVASRLSFQWPRINFCSTSRELCRSSRAIWHTRLCTLMVIKSLLMRSGLRRGGLIEPELNQSAHYPRKPCGLSHDGRTAELRDDQRTAPVVRELGRRPLAHRARSRLNGRERVSSQGDRPRGVQQAFRLSPRPKCIQYFQTSAADRCSVFTPWQRGHRASMINRSLQASSPRRAYA